MIVLLHGFNSAAKTQEDYRIKLLQTVTEDVRAITYDSFAPADEIEKYILAEIGDEFVDAVIGTSLGGYWATRIGSLIDSPWVAINPTYTPSETLNKYVGIESTNYKTGEKKTLDCDVVASYVETEFYGPGLVLVDEGDEVLDSLATVAYVAERVPVITFPNGSHRFEHWDAAIDDIRYHVNRAPNDETDD